VDKPVLWPGVLERVTTDRSSCRIRGGGEAVSDACGSRKGGISVIIPHGGESRFPQLAATLPALRQCSGIQEVIVVELAESPLAEQFARRWADKYVFARHSAPFDRARALNIGIPFAARDLLLWQDNDLVLPEGFVPRAAAEMRARSLDFLTPYTSIRYLSKADSAAVMKGTRRPVDCDPVNIFYSRRAISGGAGLVRRAFVKRYGGLPEGFRGWGGEDEAWAYKAYLLGRAAHTGYDDQHLYHLYHSGSGGYCRRAPISSPSDYAHNLALLSRIMSVREPARFAELFGPKCFSCPWPERAHIVFLTRAGDPRNTLLAERVARCFRKAYGSNIEPVQVPDGVALEQVVPQHADAIVLFGSGLASDVGAARLRARLDARVVVVSGAGHRPKREGYPAKRFDTIVTADPMPGHLTIASTLARSITSIAGRNGRASRRRQADIARGRHRRVTEPALVALLAEYARSYRYWSARALGRDDRTRRAVALARRFQYLSLRVRDWLAAAG
jgi:N-terminal domain of galactosyltransferase